MYINLKELTKDLETRFKLSCYNVFDTIMISNIEMLPQKKDLTPQDLDDHVLYVCEYRKIRHLSPFQRMAPLVCVVEPNSMPDKIFFESRSIIVIYNSSISEVLLELTHLIYQYGRSSSEILEISQILIECKSPEELLDKAYEILGNPIVITDAKQKVLNYTAPSIVRNSEASSECVEM